MKLFVMMEEIFPTDKTNTNNIFDPERQSNTKIAIARFQFTE